MRHGRHGATNGRIIGMLKRTIAVSAICVLSLASLVSSTARVSAQGADVNSKKVTLNLENADLRYALKLLFTSAGVNYALDQSVQGTCTVALTDVPFRTALESVLRSTQSLQPLTYRVEDGVYYIAPKVEKPEEGVQNPDENKPP